MRLRLAGRNRNKPTARAAREAKLLQGEMGANGSGEQRSRGAQRWGRQVGSTSDPTPADSQRKGRAGKD